MIMMDTPIETLYDKKDKILFFQNLSKEEIKEIVTEVKLMTLKQGEILIQEGEENGQDIYYILTGSLNISTEKKGLICTVDQPGLYGEMSVLTKEPRSATIEANEDRTLIVKFQIKELREDSTISKFYANVINELSSKITNTINPNI